MIENLKSHYHEILFSLDCGNDVLDEIVCQIIVDKILDNGEAVEFLSSDMVDVCNFDDEVILD
ncbi:hypothetical protein LS73_004125 [Helicobacter muridarum]|uniref:Uncharacterized protein n=1 Tax=Helicobacter muridarum TaxID=216 RepID=A0A099TYY6_9HELI|nr:hypothetical protein [Helicobacter muridarum]TLE00602.1 hypothetical protein LS73_004125 [Helicobacter muridarum]STQ85619.1 Uncharacterised protein [Helicobacter muridarum]